MDLELFKKIFKYNERSAIPMENRVKVERIDENNYDRIFAISDLHGQYDLFLRLLEKIELKREDLLLILGDICDRGKKSYEIYMKCMKMIKLGYNLKFILGNHEDMLLEDFENDYPLNYETEYSIYKNSKYFEKKNIEKWHKENFPAEVKWLIKWLKDCPLIVCGNENIFVHAGLDLSKDLENQERENVLWTREEFWMDKKNTLEEYKNKNIYFGHTPNLDGKISKKSDKIYDIDCGTAVNVINFVRLFRYFTIQIWCMSKIYIFIFILFKSIFLIHPKFFPCPKHIFPFLIFQILA